LRQAREGADTGNAETVLAGDVFYDADVAARSEAILAAAASRGAEVLIGDPWRAPLPVGRLTVLADYAVSEREGLPPARASVFAFGSREERIAPQLTPLPA
jgi:predicted nicotinamide N-methyase